MGTAHCGSTLLTMVLGGHSDCLAIGELSNLPDLYGRGRPVCSACDGECTLWDRRFSADDYELLCAGLAEQRLHKHIPLKLEKAFRGALKTDQVFNPYTLIASKVEEPIIVDSTKTVYWLEKKLAAREFRQDMIEPYLLHLIRDGRAVMASYSRRKVYQDMSDEQFGRSFGKMWQARLKNEYRFYDKFAKRFGGRYADHQRRFRYETFATQPEEMAKSLCDWLGIPFERNMLDYRNHKNHIISGNERTKATVQRHQRQEGIEQKASKESPWKQHHESEKMSKVATETVAEKSAIQDFGIKLNQQWKDILSEAQIAAFYRATNRMNERYEWNCSAPLRS